MAITKEDQVKLTKKLGLIDAVDSQDWELEASDQARIDEFIAVAEEDLSLTKGMRRALITLCVSSYDDYLNSFKRKESIEVQLAALLKEDEKLLKELCRYWDVDGPEEDSFNVRGFLEETRKQ